MFKTFEDRVLAGAVLLFGFGLWTHHAAEAQMLQTRERYQIHVGDQLEVKFRLTPEFNQTVTVQPDGFVDLGVAGEVHVGTLTVHAAETAIADESSKRLKNPDVTISLLNFEKPYFVVAGEVQHPARYDMHEPTSAMQAMLIAGGPNANSRVSQVIIFRRISGQGAQVKLLDLKDMKKTADLERDWELQSGDIVYVPRSRIAKFSQITRIGTDMGVYLNPMQGGW